MRTGDSLNSIESSRESWAEPGPEPGPYSVSLVVDDALRLHTVLMRRT